ncbi:MAG: peptidase M28, partial [Muriicola sp.]
MKKLCTLFTLLICIIYAQAQTPQEMAAAIEKEATENTQLPNLAHELMDVIGPRLVGTPQMKNAHDWAVKTYAKWGISAENETWGTWRGWERGITHIDMISPRVASLTGRQLAWSPGTSSKGITASLITIPTLADSLEFKKWVSNV